MSTVKPIMDETASNYECNDMVLREQVVNALRTFNANETHVVMH